MAVVSVDPTDWGSLNAPLQYKIIINYIDKYIIVKLNLAAGNERNKRSLDSIILSGTIILTVSYGKSLYLEEIRVLECHALGWFPWACHKKALIWPRILAGLRWFLYYFGKKILLTV